jgi:YHS domain-containing protein
MRAFAWAVLVVSVVMIAADVPDPAQSELPTDLASFAPLIGAWKGMGIPTANRLRGWPERHVWAWKFQDGHPIGLNVAIEGGKIVVKGQLSFDSKSKLYRLESQDAGGKTISYSGSVDKSGRALTLDRAGPEKGGKERLTIRLNSNQIRYTMWLDRQDPGAPQFHRVIDINLGKEGEQFAAGASTSNVPKCIVTGGSASLTVTYEGKSFPICCTGCRDEFLESPAKYIQKAALRAQNAAKTKPAAALSSGVGKDDGAFDGLLDEPKSTTSKVRSNDRPKAAPKSEPKSEGAPPPAESKSSRTADPDTRAASLLRSAKSLEKLGQTAAAVESYRRIVTKYPGTLEAKTAAERIKLLAPK